MLSLPVLNLIFKNLKGFCFLVLTVQYQGYNLRYTTIKISYIIFFSKSFGPFVRHNIYPISDTNGLKLFIHNKSYPSPGVFDTPISLESGRETSIIIDKTLSTIMPLPYDSCTDLTNGFNSDLYNYVISTNKTYRQKDCLNAGYQQEIQIGS